MIEPSEGNKQEETSSTSISIQNTACWTVPAALTS